MQELLKELSRKLNVESSVKFSGFVEEKLKPFYFKSADVFCLTFHQPNANPLV